MQYLVDYASRIMISVLGLSRLLKIFINFSGLLPKVVLVTTPTEIHLR